MRYVELNPVRAALVASAADYAWSSAVIHLGGPDTMQLVAMEEWRAGWSTEEWADILRSGEDRAQAVREATYSGRPLGSEGFITRIETHLSRRIARGKVGRPKPCATIAMPAKI